MKNRNLENLKFDKLQFTRFKIFLKFRVYKGFSSLKALRYLQNHIDSYKDSALI